MVTENGESGDERAANDEEQQTPHVVVDLPQQEAHEVPEEEQAVALDDLTIDPALLVGGSTTLSIPLTPPLDRSREERFDLATIGEAPALVAAQLGQRRRDSLRDSEPDIPSLLGTDSSDQNKRARVSSDGVWSRALQVAGLNLSSRHDANRSRERGSVGERLARDVVGSARFVPVLSRDEGVGQTTLTALLGMVLAEARDDRVLVVDACAERGHLDGRLDVSPSATIHSLVDAASPDGFESYAEFSHFVAHSEGGVDVAVSALGAAAASHASDRVSRATAHDLERALTLAQPWYSLVLTDLGARDEQPSMHAILERSSAFVIVVGGRGDGMPSASRMIEWLDGRGYSELADRALIVLNGAAENAPDAEQREFDGEREALEQRGCRIIALPYDPQLVSKAAVSFDELRAETIDAAREIAASLIDIVTEADAA